MGNDKKYIAVHCADTPAGMDIGAEEITRWHTDPPPAGRGWSAIGYAYVIRRSGALELGRDLDHDGNVVEETGAHVAGFNAESIGVCLVGGMGPDGKPEANFTEEQMRVLKWLLDELESKFPGIEIKGHRDFPGVTKACPSFDVRHWRKTGEINV